MPASDNPTKDREIFYKILTMDNDGLWRRKAKRLSAREIVDILSTGETQGIIECLGEAAKWCKGISKEEKERLEKLAFLRLPYEKKLEYCVRPEEIDGPSPDAWKDINAHLGTHADNLVEFFDELSIRDFGHRTRIGDCFCGGGSIPFEAARLGLDAYGSDLSPVAALLTWAAIHLVGGGPDLQEEIRRAQEEVWKKVDEQITAWGIEHDSEGNRADAYLYCVEVKSPATGLWVPLAPSWVIGERTRTIATLEKNEGRLGYDILVVQGVEEAQIEQARNGTIRNGEMICPETGQHYSIAGLRGDRRGPNGETIYGLRLWENEDLVPRPDDVFQERLYCVRWVTPGGERLYKSVTKEDLDREAKVLTLLREHFDDWQAKGFIPSKQIPRSGDKTEEPIRERGWTYWHHLFNPRQLLLIGCFLEKASENKYFKQIVLSIGRLADWNSRLSGWMPHAGNEKGNNTFYNQSLNTLFNYSVRPCLKNDTSWYFSNPIIQKIQGFDSITTLDARDVGYIADLWITDPPYADAVNYHELADFFLAWYEKHLPRLFPEWYADSHAPLAVRGADEDFKRSMVDIYTNLAHHMPDDGFQLVMFTHQNPAVWADLGMILWAAGLRVTAAWTIGTETSSGLKKGNYVQSTVCLVLRKRSGAPKVWFDELYSRIEDEVPIQLDSMKQIDDVSTPQFSDTDYQLAAYAAALRVLTSYESIEGMDIRHELFRLRQKNEKSPFEKIIDRAVSIATNYRIPYGIDKYVWRNLTPMERFYLAGLELERHKEARQGAYQELARGFGVQEYRFLLAHTAANEARFKTPTELGRSALHDTAFAGTLIRNLLYAIEETSRTESAREGLAWLRTEQNDYWARREDIQNILSYLAMAKRIGGLDHWGKDAHSAEILLGAVQNDYLGAP